MIIPGMQSNGGFVSYEAAVQNVYCQTWNPVGAQSTQVDASSFTSGTLYLCKLLHPMDRVSALRRYHGTTSWSANTSFGYVVYKTDTDVTTLTKIATVDLSGGTGTGQGLHVFATATGLIVNNPIYVGFVAVNAGALVGSFRQGPGGGFTTANTGYNLAWANGTAQVFCIGATGTTVTTAPATISVSAFTGVTANVSPPYIGLQ